MALMFKREACSPHTQSKSLRPEIHGLCPRLRSTHCLKQEWGGQSLPSCAKSLVPRCAKVLIVRVLVEAQDILYGKVYRYKGCK